MITSPATWSISDVSDDTPLTPGQLAYFRERLRNNIHEAVLECFVGKAEQGLTKAVMAKRLGKRPEQITRWLGAPGNWTLDTVSDLLLAMNCDLDVSAHGLEDFIQRNEVHELISGPDLGSSVPLVAPSFFFDNSGATNLPQSKEDSAPNSESRNDRINVAAT